MLLIALISTEWHWTDLPILEECWRQSTGVILQGYADDTRLCAGLFLFRGDSTKRTLDFLQSIDEKANNPKVEACCRILLGIGLSCDDSKSRRSRTRIVQCFSDVQQKYKNEEIGEIPLATLAGHYRFAFEHLSVGAEACEIEGESWDGTKIQLTKLRGKVVVLFFFVNWCPACRHMYPEIRATQAHYQGQDVEILGVIGQDDATLRSLVQSAAVTWPCLVGEGENKESIVETWQISSWPTVYLIDPAGKLLGCSDARSTEELNKQIDWVLSKPEARRTAPVGTAVLDKLEPMFKQNQEVDVVNYLSRTFDELQFEFVDSDIARIASWYETALTSERKGDLEVPKVLVRWWKASLALVQDDEVEAERILKGVVKSRKLDLHLRTAAQLELAYLMLLRVGSDADIVEAREFIDQGAKGEGQSLETRVYELKALVDIAQQDFDAARNHLEEAMESEPPTMPRCLFHLAYVEVKTGNIESARAILDEAVALGLTPGALLPSEKSRYDIILNAIQSAQ